MINKGLISEVVKAAEKIDVPDDIPLTRDELFEIATQSLAALAVADFKESARLIILSYGKQRGADHRRRGGGD